MTVKVTPKMTPKKAKNDTHRVKNDTQGSKMTLKKQMMTLRIVKMTPKWHQKWHQKNIYIDDTQNVKNMPIISMTSKMTPRIKEWNYMFLKQTSEMAVKSSINDCLGKEK